MNWDGADIGWAESYYEHYDEHYLSRESSSDIGCLYSSFYTALVFGLSKYLVPHLVGFTRFNLVREDDAIMVEIT